MDSDTHAIPWIAACQAPLSFTVSWSLFKLTSIESVLLFYHLILCRPLLLSSIFPSIRVFSSESALSIRWPKYWSFSIRPSNEYSALISFKDGASRSETGNYDSFVFLISIEPSSPAWQLTSGKPCFPDLQSELSDASLASQQAEVEHHTLGLIKIALTTLRGTLEVGEAVFFIFPARLRNYDQLFNPSPGGSRTTASFLRPRGQREPQRKKGTLPSEQVSYGNKQI